MGTDFYLFVCLTALALGSLFWAVSRFWRDARGAEPQRLRRRIGSAARAPLFAELEHSSSRHTRGERWGKSIESRLVGVEWLKRLIAGSGSNMGLLDFIGLSLMLAIAALLIATVMRQGFVIVVMAAILASLLPLVHVLRLRGKRRRMIEAQIPDALQLMAHAMQAGRTLSSALHVVGVEGSNPIADEFRATFDEIAFGLSEQSALANLAERTGVGDLRYFVVAVLIQRESGGNLAELLLLIAALVRQRMELRGSIKVLSAEGRLSAWILGLMPFVIAAAIGFLNPKFLTVLWTDPIGIRMVIGALILQILGAGWMWRVIQIRV